MLQRRRQTRRVRSVVLRCYALLVFALMFTWLVVVNRERSPLMLDKKYNVVKHPLAPFYFFE